MFISPELPFSKEHLWHWVDHSSMLEMMRIVTKLIRTPPKLSHKQLKVTLVTKSYYYSKWLDRSIVIFAFTDKASWLQMKWRVVLLCFRSTTRPPSIIHVLVFTTIVTSNTLLLGTTQLISKYVDFFTTNSSSDSEHLGVARLGRLKLNLEQSVLQQYPQQ